MIADETRYTFIRDEVRNARKDREDDLAISICSEIHWKKKKRKNIATFLSTSVHFYRK